MKKVLIYARVSTTRDQDIGNQIMQLRRYAESQQWNVFQVVTDQLSGSKGVSERKGLETVFSMAHRKQFDVLLFWSLDRLSREGARKTVEYLSRLESMGIGWHSFTEPYLSTMGMFSDAVVGILATLAKQERIRIGERTKAGMERVRALGVQLGRPKTPVSKITEIVQLRKSGLTLAEIGTRMNLSPARICQIVKMGS